MFSPLRFEPRVPFFSVLGRELEASADDATSSIGVLVTRVKRALPTSRAAPLEGDVGSVVLATFLSAAEKVLLVARNYVLLNEAQDAFFGRAGPPRKEAWLVAAGVCSPPGSERSWAFPALYTPSKSQCTGKQRANVGGASLVIVPACNVTDELLDSEQPPVVLFYGLPPAKLESLLRARREPMRFLYIVPPPSVKRRRT